MFSLLFLQFYTNGNILTYYSKYGSTCKKDHYQLSEVDDKYVDPFATLCFSWSFPGCCLWWQTCNKQWFSAAHLSLDAIFIGASCPYLCSSIHLPSPWPILPSFPIQLLGFLILGEASGPYWSLPFLKLLIKLSTVYHVLPFTSMLKCAFVRAHFSNDSPQWQYRVLNIFVVSKTPERMGLT